MERMHTRNWCLRSLVLLVLTGLVPFGLCPGGSAVAAGLAVEIKAVAILTDDDQGVPLKSPSGVFLDRMSAEIFVVNSGGSRIVIYGPDYFPRLSIGAGRGINAPYGVQIDGDGRLYVCQGNPPRLTILNAAFFPVKEIDFAQLKGAEAFIPRRVALGSSGKMYVAGVNNRGVLVLDKDGGYLGFLTPMDEVWSEDGTSNAPKPVMIIEACTDSTGRLYLLSEETSKVYVYDKDENFLFSFGQKGGSSGKMSRPRGIAVDNERCRIYLVDYMRQTILVYDLAGRYIFEFGGRGFGPGWFNYPTSVAVDRLGHVVVADLFNNRVQVLDVPLSPSGPTSEGLTQGDGGVGTNFLPVPPSKKRR
jgi:DNA-binding beta-propeller fold protein YncE